MSPEKQAPAADGISPLANVIPSNAKIDFFPCNGHHVVSKTLSPLIVYLIELEISRQFLGKLENVNWSKPLTEHNRYAAVMLLSDVRRRLHNDMKYVDLPQRIYLDAQREFEQVQASIDVLGKLDIWGCGRGD
jgi:hypothetical protein